MAYSAPSTVSTGDLCSAATWNQDVVANPIAIYAGAMSVTSQAVGDILYASSTTQFARVAAVAAGQVLASAGTGTVPAYSATPALTSVDMGGTTVYGSRAITVDTGGVLNVVLASAAGDDFTVDTDKLVVSGDTGYIGVGTADPTKILHVIGDIKLQSSQVHLSDGYGLLWGDNGINGNASTDSLRLDTAGGARLTINSAGLVTIGNNLTVTGASTLNNTLTINYNAVLPVTLQRDSGSNGHGVGFDFKLGDSASASAGHSYGQVIVGIADNTDGGEDGNFFLNLSDDGTMTEALRVFGATGDVSIGASDDLARARIYKASANVPSSGTTSNAHLMLEGTDNAVMIFGQTSGSPYNGWIQQSDKGNYSFNYPLALNPDGGDVYSTGWTDYYSSSTIVGWSSLTSGRRQIMYRTLGNMVFVAFHLEGTSDATTISFTVPYTSATIGSEWYYTSALGFTYDNGGYKAAGRLGLPSNSNVVSVHKAELPGGWTASGSKIVSGQFWYQKA